MDIQKKGKELIVKIKLGKKDMWKVSKGRNFKTISIYKVPQVCMGYSSRTEGNLNIILADYDGVDKSVVFEEIKALRERFRLPPAYLLTSGEKEENGAIIGNYHVVFLSTYTSRDVFDILGYLSIDENFRNSPLRKTSKSWILRLSEKKGSGKIKFLEIIGNDNLDKEVSSAHLKLLSKFFPEIKHPEYIEKDCGKLIKLQLYETR